MFGKEIFDQREKSARETARSRVVVREEQTQRTWGVGSSELALRAWMRKRTQGLGDRGEAPMFSDEEAAYLKQSEQTFTMVLPNKETMMAKSKPQLADTGRSKLKTYRSAPSNPQERHQKLKTSRSGKSTLATSRSAVKLEGIYPGMCGPHTARNHR